MTTEFDFDKKMHDEIKMAVIQLNMLLKEANSKGYRVELEKEDIMIGFVEHPMPQLKVEIYKKLK